MTNEKERRMNRRQFIKYTGAAAAVAAAAGVAGYYIGTQQIPATPTTPEKTLIIAVETDMALIDPHAPSPSRPSQAVFAALYDTLIEVHREESTEIPGMFVAPNVDLQDPLIASQEWSEDNKAVTWKIKEGIKFHDGKELTADDVVWTLKRFEGWTGGYGPTYIPMMSYEGIEKVDDYTVKMTFTKDTPMSRKFQALKEGTSILNSELIKSEGVTDEDPFAAEWLRKNDAGAGPYYMERFYPSSEVVFRAFEDYHRGKPSIDKVIFKFVAEASDRAMMLKAGAIDMISPWGWLPKDLPSMRADPDIVLYEAPNPGILEFQINHLIEPFGEKLVRKALAYAIPYDAIMDNVMYGSAVQLTSFVMKGLPTHTDEFCEYEHDLDKAQDLLDQTDYAGGFETDLYYQTGQTMQKDIAEWVEAEWVKLGVTVNIKALTAAAYSEFEKSGDMPLHFHVFTPFVPDPFYALRWIVHSNTSYTGWPLSQHYENDRVDELIALGMDSRDTEKRLEWSREVQEITCDELPQFLLLQRKSIIPARKNIKNVTIWFDDCFGRGMQYITKE